MSVTETLDALGSWSLALNENTPKAILDKLTYFGHICVDIGDQNQQMLSDGLLPKARYVGVLRDKDAKDTGYTIGGQGMAMWLGDADQKGYVIEAPLTITAQTFQNSVRALLPASVHEGTLFNTVAGTFTNIFQYTDPRTALDYLCSTMNAEWRINGDATLDAGLKSDLYRSTPICALVRKGMAGVDLRLRAMPGDFEAQQDVEDFTTRVLLLGSGDSGAVLDATADINPVLNPFKDMFGNFVKLTRMVSESETDAANAPARAQLQLNRFTGARNALTLDTEEYDIKGEVFVGDNLYVYDPVTGLFDETNEVTFRGERLNPLVLRCTELTWPVIKGMCVGFRDGSGNWTDLTPYVEFETGTTTVVVGGYDRSLVSTGETVGSRPLPDTSIPGIPTWNTPFVQAIYQSAITGRTEAQVQLNWNRPTNTDGSAILDGDYYEIRYRHGTTPIFPVTWQQLEIYRWQDIETSTWASPLTYPATDWQFIQVAFDQLVFLLQGLVPSMPYEAQIRAIDAATPPNVGSWSTLTTWQTSGDTIAPVAPAPPTVATSLISVQVTHTLGAASGGTFNLDADLHHLEVHGQYEPLFTPSDGTLLGKLIANNGMITGGIPAVGTFQVGSTAPVYFKVIAVDDAGNKSSPSTAVAATATLIDDAHISDLTVSKVTAGTITADWIVSGSIKTAVTGARVEMNNAGLWGFDATNTSTFHIDDTNGQVTITGLIQSGGSGARFVTNPVVGGVNQAECRWYPNSGVGPGYVSAAASQNSLGFAGDGLLITGSSFTNSTGIEGGRLVLSKDTTLLGYQKSGGVPDMYIFMRNDGSISVKGGFAGGDAAAGQTYFWTNIISMGSNSTNASAGFGYGATMINGLSVFTSAVSSSGVWSSNPFNTLQTGFSASLRQNGAGTETCWLNAWVTRYYA